MSAVPEILVDTVLAAAGARRPLCIRAGGTKDFYGGAAQGELLDPRVWKGVQAHEPSELYITARAGTPLAEMETLLAQHDQMLAFEPPHFGAGATAGGCLAAGLSGPRRCAAGYASGAVRDHVLGARLLDGRGRVLQFGGTVIKNVAGYDVARLLAGSLGILGVILEVTFKVLPRPAEECSLRFEASEDEALQWMNLWAGQPLPLSASSWREGVLTVRLSGAAAALREGCRVLGGERMAESAAAGFWQGLREHTDPWFAATTPLWRLGVPSAAPSLALGGAQLVEWGGAQRWLRTHASHEEVVSRARALGGHATQFRHGDRSRGVFTALSPPLLAIHQRLKDEFDPARIFNPGRMYPEL